MLQHIRRNSSFLFIAECYSVEWIYHVSFIHSSVHGYLGCFYLLTIMNNAAVNICLQALVWTYFVDYLFLKILFIYF